EKWLSAISTATSRRASGLRSMAARAQSCSASFSFTSPRRGRGRGASTAPGIRRRRSGNLSALVETRLVPLALREDVSQDLGGADHFFEAVVQRCEAEAHEVRRAEIADHAAGDE